MALDNIPTLGPGGFNGNLDKVLVYKNGGSEVACSLLTLTNSALNPAGVYLDIPNQRMGIGTNSPLATAHIKGIGTTSSTTSLLVQNSAGTTAFNIKDNGVTNATYIEGGMCWFNNINSNGIVKFGSSLSVGFNTDPIAQLQIKGSGSTSATTSLLVQNSGGTELFKVRDDGYVNVAATNGMNIGGLYLSGLSYNGTINFGNNDLSIGCDVNGRRVNLYSGNTNVLTVFKSATNYGVGISDSGSDYPTPSAVLQVNSTTRGFLKPKMTTAQKNAIVTPAAGLEVYDTDLNRPCFFNGTSWITL